MDAEQSLSGLTVSRLLEEVAARTPAPGGGAVAAFAAALAAGLTGMAARFDDHQQVSAARADELRAAATALADADVAAHRAYWLATHTPREDDPWMWPSRLREAFDDTVDVPLEVVRVAEQVTLLAAALASGGEPRRRGNAVAAALLAAAAANAAALLVAENLAGDPEDVRAGCALGLAAAARRCADGLVSA